MTKKPKKYNPYYHSRRNQEAVSIGDALKGLFKAMRIDTKMAEVQILKTWNETMGEFIARKTSDIYLKEDVLTIRVDSAVLRKELQMNEQSIIDLMNRSIGQETINRIIVR